MKIFYIINISIGLLFIFILAFTIDYFLIYDMIHGTFKFSIKGTVAIVVLQLPAILFFILTHDYIVWLKELNREKIRIGDRVKYSYNNGLYYRTVILDIVDKYKDGYVIKNEDIKFKVSKEYILKNRIESDL